MDLFAMNKPHLMAMLLKAYLRELRRPLIVPELFSKFIIVNGTFTGLASSSLSPLNELLSLARGSRCDSFGVREGPPGAAAQGSYCPPQVSAQTAASGGL